MEHKRLLLIDGASCGGAERMTLLYGKILEKVGFDITLMVNKNAGVYSFPLMPFIPTKWTLLLNNSKARWVMWHIWRGISKIKPDLIFTSMGDLNKIVLTLKKFGLCRSKVIIRCNNMPSKFSQNEHKMATYLYKYADAIIAQTDEMKDEMLKYYQLPSDRVVTLNNPIDKELIESKISESYPFDRKYTNFVAVGRIHKQKDYSTMLQAFALVLKENPESRLYIVGGFKADQEKQKIDNLVSSLNLSESVFLEGFQANPYKYIKDCDVFCLSSEIEGLPNVLLDRKSTRLNSSH